MRRFLDIRRPGAVSSSDTVMDLLIRAQVVFTQEFTMVTEDQVRKALRKVKDPELNLDLVVLGLIYDIKIEGDHVDMTMSLTSPACPVAGEIVNSARTAIEQVDGVESADVELTFSPPWTPERIPAMIRSALGI
ncbi:MAG TPA: metal-sulfur cluster assembly factor [Longimicrobiaceae bacterium]|nr:metal-sulfur cluster assembly factor [Longimicrobiaceae bacterium]